MSAFDEFMDSLEGLNEDNKGLLKGGFEAEATPEEEASLNNNWGYCTNYHWCWEDNIGYCNNYGHCGF